MKARAISILLQNEFTALNFILIPESLSFSSSTLYTLYNRYSKKHSLKIAFWGMWNCIQSKLSIKFGFSLWRVKSAIAYFNINMIYLNCAWSIYCYYMNYHHSWSAQWIIQTRHTSEFIVTFCVFTFEYRQTF